MSEGKTFEIEIDSTQPDQDAHELAERFISSDVRRHLSEESVHMLRSLTTSKMQLQLGVPAVFSIAHALISWLKAKPSGTRVIVRTESGVYPICSGEDGNTEPFLEFLRSSMVTGAVSNPPKVWSL